MVSLRSPTVTTLTLFAGVFALQQVAAFLGVALATGLFVLSPPPLSRPWTLVTSVYAHGSVGHLLANAVALLLPGFVIERRTSSVRYHLFFVSAGALAGVVQITVGDLLGEPTGVLGASGAIFAFMGYLLTGNRLTDAVLGGVEVSGRAQLAVFVLVAVGVTVATRAPGVALVAHFTGLFVGLLAGRLHLLRAPGRR